MMGHETTAAYEYELPEELIAQQPLPVRSDARLMVVDRRRGAIEHHHVRDLAELLRPADILVANDSRVLPARLVGYRQRTGGRWQGLFLGDEPHGLWRLICKTRGRLTAGERIVLQDRSLADCLLLELVMPLGDGSWVAKPHSERPTLELLAEIGRVPLPHYIRGGEMVEADVDRYQTVYADRPGSVAAPTAGLHFTPALLTQLAQRGIPLCRITLHVGLGTFRLIQAGELDEHRMHAEWCEVGAEAVAQLASRRAGGGRVVAVGTTTVRALESAARSGTLAPWCGRTELFIRPPFTFHAVDALLTNFHLPRSTLLVLVRTFGGDDLIRRAYQEAVEQRYRFYSYGDAMLIV